MKTNETSNSIKIPLEWYRNLDYNTQEYFKKKYDKKVFGSYNEPKIIEEICYIWQKETNQIEDKVFHYQSPDNLEELYSKSNQKQYKQFNESLFRAYISKFTELSKRKAIEILLKDCDFQKAELIKDEFNLKLKITKF